VLTVQDLSFETDRSLMGARDRLMFRTQVKPSARRAARVLTGSERTRDDLSSSATASTGRRSCSLHTASIPRSRRTARRRTARRTRSS
jgi:hypothetical protein